MTTDPDATYMTKGNRAAELGYFDNHLIDNPSCVMVGVQATAARLSQESAAARAMLTGFSERRGRSPQTLAADTQRRTSPLAPRMRPSLLTTVDWRNSTNSRRQFFYIFSH